MLADQGEVAGRLADPGLEVRLRAWVEDLWNQTEERRRKEMEDREHRFNSELAKVQETFQGLTQDYRDMKSSVLARLTNREGALQTLREQ